MTTNNGSPPGAMPLRAIPAYRAQASSLAPQLIDEAAKSLAAALSAPYDRISRFCEPGLKQAVSGRYPPGRVKAIALSAARSCREGIAEALGQESASVAALAAVTARTSTTPGDDAPGARQFVHHKVTAEERQRRKALRRAAEAASRWDPTPGGSGLAGKLKLIRARARGEAHIRRTEMVSTASKAGFARMEAVARDPASFQDGRHNGRRIVLASDRPRLRQESRDLALHALVVARVSMEMAADRAKRLAKFFTPDARTYASKASRNAPSRLGRLALAAAVVASVVVIARGGEPERRMMQHGQPLPQVAGTITAIPAARQPNGLPQPPSANAMPNALPASWQQQASRMHQDMMTALGGALAGIEAPSPQVAAAAEGPSLASPASGQSARDWFAERKGQLTHRQNAILESVIKNRTPVVQPVVPVAEPPTLATGRTIQVIPNPFSPPGPGMGL